MKLLFSLTYYTPYISGLTLYVKALAEGLAAKGEKVTVLSMQDKKNLKEMESLNGVKVVRVPYQIKFNKGFLSWRWFIQVMRKIAINEQIVVVLPQVEGLITALAAKLFRKRLIIIYICEITLPHGIINKTIEKVIGVIDRTCCMWADQIVTYHEDYANNVSALRKFKNKIRYTYPPITLQGSDQSLKRELKNKLENSTVVIGFVGRLATEKGVEYLLEAIPLLKERLGGKVKILVAGQLVPVGEEAYRNKIFKLAEKHKEDVMFTGEIPWGKLGSIYEMIDVLVLPSVNSTEGFGMVQVEAMLKGIPVVVTDLPGVRMPVLETGLGVIVPPRDSKAIALAVDEVIRNRERYVSPTRAARIFDFQKTINFYQNLLRHDP